MVRGLDRPDEMESAPAAGQAARSPTLFRLLHFYHFGREFKNMYAKYRN